MNVEAISEPMGLPLQDILDIEGIIRFPLTEILVLLAITGGALVFLALLFLILRRRAKKRGAVNAEELLLPHEKAFLELDRLEKQGLLEKGEGRKYTWFLSEIFRRYLEERYLYPALEKTTNEILPDLKQKVGLSPALCNMADHFFCQADLVKFARFHPSPEWGRQEKEKIVEFVRATTPETKPPI